MSLNQSRDYNERLHPELRPIESRTGDHNSTRAIGHAAEVYVCERLNLDHDPNCYYDALGVGGTPVQIKAARWRVRNGRTPYGHQAWTQGQFRLYEYDHAKLHENNGVYAFLVYERHPQGIIPLYLRVVYPEFLDQTVLPEDGGWYDHPNLADKAEGGDRSVQWSKIFPNTGAEP